MAKIMIVEDDRNLQSIYGDRLTAEGHTIITASDGEEALAIAVKEKPDLIISDVMMPKISGFDMLDILRTTPETRNVKIIMMTALSQAEDRERADKLGADKYLVKSQVTLDDVARTVNEIVSGATPVTDGATTDSIASSNDPVAVASSTNDEQAKISSQIDEFLRKNVPAEQPISTSQPSTPDTPQGGQRVVQPISDINAPKSNIFDLYEKELAKEAEATKPEQPKVEG